MAYIGNAPAAGVISGDNIQDSTVGTADLATGAVTTAKLADAAVTTAKIADGAVVTADIADSAVTSAKLASTAVTDKLGYMPVNKAGDTMSGTLQVPQLNINSRRQFDLTNIADESNINWNDVVRNSVSYALGSSHTNAPIQGVNSIVVDLNTEGMGGTHNTGSDTRGVQLWFTDTPGGPQGGNINGRFCIRPKQGASWHPWEKVLTTYSFRRNLAVQSGTMVVTGSSWQDIAGCSVSLTPVSAASRFLLIARFAGYFNPSGDAQGRILRNDAEIYVNARIAGNQSTQHESSTNIWLDHPNTTGAVTYRLQGAMTGSTGSFDYGHAGNPCVLLIMEFEG